MYCKVASPDSLAERVEVVSLREAFLRQIRTQECYWARLRSRRTDEIPLSLQFVYATVWEALDASRTALLRYHDTRNYGRGLYVDPRGQLAISLEPSSRGRSGRKCGAHESRYAYGRLAAARLDAGVGYQGRVR